MALVAFLASLAVEVKRDLARFIGAVWTQLRRLWALCLRHPTITAFLWVVLSVVMIIVAERVGGIRINGGHYVH